MIVKAITVLALFAASLNFSEAAETYTAKTIASFPDTQTPNGLLTVDHGAVYGIAFDYKDYSDTSAYLGSWVYRVGENGAYSNPCPVLKGAAGTNVVFDHRGNGYTLGPTGVMRFDAGGHCQLVAKFGNDLKGQLSGSLTVAPTDAVFGSTQSGQLFFVDFAHRTTRVLTSFRAPAGTTGAFLTGVSAAPDLDQGLYGTFVWQAADGTAASQLFSARLDGGLKEVSRFADNVGISGVAFASGHRLVVTGELGGYLLTSTGKQLSTSVPAFTYPTDLRGARYLFYPKTIGTVGPGRYPTVTFNYLVARSGLDGSNPENLVDITAVGQPISGIAPAPDDKLYVIAIPPTNEGRTLIQVSTAVKR